MTTPEFFSASLASAGNAAPTVSAVEREQQGVCLGGGDVEDMTESQRWRLYERRKRTWLEANPGAWPMEMRDACARIAEELGL